MATQTSIKNERYKLGVFYSKLYRVIPKNCVLIIRNKFSGRDVEVRSAGHAWVAPWKEAKLISVAEKTIDYPKIEFDDSEGQTVFVDYAVTVKIVDPLKYEYSHENTEQALKILLTALMRVLIRKASWEELAGNQFEISDKGVTTGVSEISFSDELSRIQLRLKEFANKYGLAVTSLVSKDIQQSPEMQKAYDEKKRKDKEGEALVAQAKRNKEKALIDAEIKRTAADAEAYQHKNEALVNAQRLKLSIEAIKQGLAGLPPEQIAQIVFKLGQIYFLMNGKNQNTNVNLFSKSISEEDLLQPLVVNTMPNNSEENSGKNKPKTKKK